MAKTNSVRRNSAFDLTKAEFLKPQTRLDANRWLNYVSFGPATPQTDIYASTHTSIVPLSVGHVDDATRLMDIGYEAWINEQINTANDFPTITQAKLDGLANTRLSNGIDDISDWFCATAIHSQSQLKLKLAYALSQIFVVNGTKCGRNPQFLYDMYLKAVTTSGVNSFLTLTHETSMSGQMATWLTYMDNKRTQGNIRPDQNYARERMQLFSIGLVHLNQDGTPKLDSNGNEIPTYTELDVAEESKIWTGLTTVVGVFNGDPDLTGGLRFTRDNEFALESMQQNQNEASDHERGAKVLFPRLNGATFTIPAVAQNFCPIDYPPRYQGYSITVVNANTFTLTTDRPSRHHTVTTDRKYRYRTQDNFTQTPVECTINQVYNSTSVTVTKTAHGLTTGTIVWFYSSIQEDTILANIWLTTHPNVAPFISKALIRILVTSNPSNDYVRRVANVFDNNGSGVRGDLLAVAKAIMLDREAIIPFGINQNNHGRYIPLIERQIKTIRALRNEMFHENRGSLGRILTTFTRNYFTKPLNASEYTHCGWLHSGSFMPFQARSVFNHYDATYIPQGTTLGLIGKISPELQINSISTQAAWAAQTSSLTETEYWPSRGIDGNFPSFGDLNDPRGNWSSYGFEIQTHVDGFEVLAKPGGSQLQLRGIFTDNNTTVKFRRGSGYSRTSARKFAFNTNDKQTGTGLKTFLVDVFDFNGGSIADIQIGEIIDLSRLKVAHYNGFPSKGKQDDTPANTNQWDTHPEQFTFHKAASLAPTTSGIPTELELEPLFNHLQSVLFSKLVSVAGKAIAIAQCRLPIVRNTRELAGDATFDNAWINVDMSYQQKRARMMIGVLLNLPEWSTQR